MDTFSEALGEARDLLDRGGFRDAFSRISDVPVSRPDQLFEKIALMADAGIALRDVTVLEYGLYLMEHHSREILAVPSFAAFHWFNLANLRANILAVREAEGGDRCWYDRRLSAAAREAYRKAAESVAKDDILKSRILSAHGRLLVGLGRDWEAFDLFHEASVLDPDDDEAELGRIETLVAISGTAPALEEDLLREAGGRLALLEAEDDPPGLDDGIEAVKSRINHRLGTEKPEEPDYPRNTVVTNTEREHSMVMYSLKNRLYLSPCSACRKCDRAVGDAAVLGADHAVVGGKVADRYRRTALMVGRLSERYRALRTALIDHSRGAEIPDGANFQSHIPEVEGWVPIPAATVSLISALAGVRSIVEGMAACVALYLGRDLSGPVRIDHILGTPKSPGSSLIDEVNPALHGFWDLWADGVEGLVRGYEMMKSFGESLSETKVEDLSLDRDRLTEDALSLIDWLGTLIAYLIRMADRDARGDKTNPPLWPLQPFVLPER